MEAANKRPLSVQPEHPLNAATTIMQLHDFSQVPAMQNDRTLSGIISWKSIGTRLSLGRECSLVRDCMESAVEVAIQTPLFEAIGTIAEHGYVLVRAENREITGIVTASDLSRQFMQMAGPFLLIGEIEGHLRHLIHGKFTVEEMRGKTNDSSGAIEITGAADLTLGGYCRLLEHPEHWHRLNLNIDRAEFIKHLDDVRKIRNDVMHFDPDGLLPEDTQKLRDVARFFEDLVRIGAV